MQSERVCARFRLESVCGGLVSPATGHQENAFVLLDGQLAAAIAWRPVANNRHLPKRVCDGENSGPVQLYDGIVRLVPAREPREQKAARAYLRRLCDQYRSLR